MNLLLVEDREDILNLVQIYMEKEGYKVDVARDGKSGLKLIQEKSYHLCILDVMLPVLDGFQLLKEMRKFSTVPVIMLTAKDMEQDKILGLDLGADDYITKPFSVLELVSRVNSMLRRNYTYNNESLTEQRFGRWKIDQKRCLVENEGEICYLTVAEYRILSKLISEPGRIFTRSLLYKEISSDEFDIDADSCVTVHISHLREKLRDKETKYIKTIRGLGYKIEN